MKEYDLVIIGGGSAGIAAGVSAYENGLRSILIIERDKELGGILLQCIHNGFGLHMFGEELAGPAYAERFIDKMKKLGIEYRVSSMVTHITADRVVEYANPKEGYVKILAKAIILAMGCRERTRGAIAIPGFRPSGIWTAGTAQRYLNMEGYMVGKKVFILGSGDIGLIMARRMTLEGATVLGVAEIMPYSNGLPRNMKQCLEDFNIPLYLSHTITNIEGKKRITGIEITKVDENMQPIESTQKVFEVDTLLLSVGLIPENELGTEAEIILHPRTKGAIVDESFQTSVPGIFACGNALHVHDLVDFVSKEGEMAGVAATKYIKGELKIGHSFDVECENGIGYVLPQKVNVENMSDTIEFMFRVTKTYKKVKIGIFRDGQLFKQIQKPHMAPAEMEKVVCKKEDLGMIKHKLTFSVIEE